MATQTRTPIIAPTPVARGGVWASKRRQELIIRILATTVCVIGLIVILFPLFWMITTSLKTRAEVAKFPPVWIPNIPQWGNYEQALSVGPFDRYFANTMFYAVGSMLFELISCSFVAYGFARIRAPGKNQLFVLVLATMMLPFWVTLIPQYILFARLGWLDSYAPLLVPKLFANSAYLIFMLRQFYKTLPKDYEEAALIDGANYLGIWWRIILPLSLPAIGAVAIMSFMFHYQDFQGPLIYINTQNNWPFSLGLQQYRAPFGGTAFHLLMAASLVTLIPPVLLFFVFQRYFIQGIVISGVKG